MGREKLLSSTRGVGSEREQSRARRQEKHTVDLHRKRANSPLAREAWDANESGDIESFADLRGAQLIAGEDGPVLSFSLEMM